MQRTILAANSVRTHIDNFSLLNLFMKRKLRKKQQKDKFRLTATLPYFIYVLLACNTKKFVDMKIW